MGHCCQILTFSEKVSKKEISERCGRWATCNCDLEERGGFGYDTLDVHFTEKIFDCYEDAEQYLESTFGDYREIAVRYKKYPKLEPNKAIEDLKRRLDEYQKRICKIDVPHYANVTQSTVKCKNCGSSLSTKYCGKTYNNLCPVCKAELRPESVMKKRDSYKKTLSELQQKLKAEDRKQNQKNASKAEMFWAVACEVHC